MSGPRPLSAEAPSRFPGAPNDDERFLKLSAIDDARHRAGGALCAARARRHNDIWKDVNGNWNTPGNWTLEAVNDGYPNRPGDEAIFSAGLLGAAFRDDPERRRS